MNTNKYKWNLSRVFQGTSYQEELNKIKPISDEILKLKGNITTSIDNFKKYLKLSEAFSTIIGKCSYYLYNLSSSDLSNLEYQKMGLMMDVLLEPINIELSFIDNELINNIGVILKYINSDHSLAEYKFNFQHLEKSKEHKLSDIEEELIAKLNPCLGHESEIFSKLTGVDFVFNDVIDSKGKKHKLFQGNSYKLLTSNDKVLRKNTYLEFWKVYDQHKHTLAINYYNNVKNTSVFAKLYKYPNSLNMNLFSDNISEQFYTNILEQVANNNDIITEWKKIQKKVLKIADPKPWDVSGSLFPKSEKEFDKNDAKNIIFAALKNLGPDYTNKLEYMFNNELIDWLPENNKRSGAYSYCVWKSDPYILMNWNGKYTDVSTLIHELGHSIHSLYSNSEQSFANHNYPIFLAEVASIVNEILLIFYFLEKEKDNSEFQKYILENAIKEFIAVIFRQSQFAEFEKIIHNKVDNGEIVGLDEFKQTANKLRDKYFPKLPGHKYKDKYQDLWGLYVPHFYSDFYVYKYVTGCICACIFAKKIMENDKSTIDNYLLFLKSGGSDYPLNILKKAGIDLTDNFTIEEAFKLIKLFLKKLGKII